MSEMMSKLDSALVALNNISQPYGKVGLTSISLLLVTLAYVVTMLSVSLQQPEILVWFAVYPVIQSEISGIGFGKVFLKSLWVLPLIIFIGIFNPFFDTQQVISVGGISISTGWISFFSIILRGLMAVQAIIILALCAGFYDICNGLRKMGVPKIMVSQMQFTYRYMIVIIEEAISMDRAHKSRGFGKKSYPLKLWGILVGQLLIRSYERARRINMAMLSRGFDGVIPQNYDSVSYGKSWVFLVIWISIFLMLRFFSPAEMFNML